MQPKITGTSAGIVCSLDSFLFLSFHRLFSGTEPSTSICTELWRHLKQSSHWHCLTSRRAAAFPSPFVIFYSNKCRVPIQRSIHWGTRLFYHREWRCWESSWPFQNLSTLSEGSVWEISAVAAWSRCPEQQRRRDAAGANADPDATFQRAQWRACCCSNQARMLESFTFKQTCKKN